MPHLVIEYEKYLLEPDDQHKTMNLVFDYLNLSPHDAETDFSKVTEKDLSDIIENYDELEKKLMQSEYAQFLGWG